MADSFGSSSSENEGTKFVKDGFEQASKWNATSVEVDNNMLKGRRTQRGFTINMGKPEAVQRPLSSQYFPEHMLKAFLGK